MTDLNVGKATTTELTSGVDDFSVDTVTPDQPSKDQKETSYSFPNASQDLGYYKTIPQYNSVTKALATWSVGLGFTVENPSDEVILRKITGAGGEGISDILFNMEVMKKALGDSMAEIIRNPDTGTLLNLKPLWLGNMAVWYNEKGTISHYTDNRNPSVKIQTEDILHLANDRIANEMHGNPSSAPLKWMIEAKEEALRDWKRISHRSTIRVLYIEVDNTSKLNDVRKQYKEGIANGEVLILPIAKGEAQFEDLQLPPVESFLAWMRYLDNLFYQTSGVPKIIATSEDFTEAGGKVGFLTFQPIYTKEQTDMEQAFLLQLGITIKFNRPPQLGGMLDESEKKNTGQTGIQPSDTEVDIERNE